MIWKMISEDDLVTPTTILLISESLNKEEVLSNFKKMNSISSPLPQGSHEIA